MYKTLELNNREDIVLPVDRMKLYNHVQINDSLVKRSNSLWIEVFRKNVLIDSVLANLGCNPTSL